MHLGNFISRYTIKIIHLDLLKQSTEREGVGGAGIMTLWGLNVCRGKAKNCFCQCCDKLGNDGFRQLGIATMLFVFLIIWVADHGVFTGFALISHANVLF